MQWLKIFYKHYFPDSGPYCHTKTDHLLQITEVVIIMNKKIKTIIITAAVLTGGLVAAIWAYNSLSGHFTPENAGNTVVHGETVNIPGMSVNAEKETTNASGEKAMAAYDFAMLDKEGNTVRLSDHYGKPVVLNFWASWCPPCRSEMPAFDKLNTEKGDIVNVMMVNMTDGYRDDFDSVITFAEENGYGFPVYFDTGNKGAKGYGIFSLPTTVFINADGTVAETHMGAMSEETLNVYVDKLLYPQ